jgi:alpha-glucosidase (family GH31 glycosyl hydrolase)
MQFTSAQETDRGLRLNADRSTMEVSFLAPGIVRLRGWEGKEPPMSPLLRYGLWRREWDDVDVRVETGSSACLVATGLMTVDVAMDGALSITGAQGEGLLSTAEAPMLGPDPGFRARFELPEAERFFGLGDQTRDRIEHRGTKGDLWIRNVEEYIPIPFVMSTRGYGLVTNTTRRVWYDLGATSDDWFGFECRDEALDLYVVYGPSPAEILERYTRVTGRPLMPPRWAFGLWFICRTQADAHEFVSDCRNFRDREIPCDAIGLEPGWMQKFYDASVDKDWHEDRFPMPRYDRTNTNFFSVAQKMGFKPGLWLCNDYDLLYEEERRVDEEIREADAAGDDDDLVFAEGHEIDEHLQGARMLDGLTKPEEPWFEHLKKFVYEGAHWFKQDGAFQCLEHPDRVWGAKLGEQAMTDDQMHNLYPLLYSKQMYLGFRETDERDSGVPERTLPFTVDGWAGLQRWTGTWTGDTGGGEEPLVACLNLAMSGHGMNTVDMASHQEAAIHFGCLLPWAQLNSWNYFRHPWCLGDRIEEFFRQYVQFRYRLIPYLYSIAWEAHRTGMPLMRPMPLMWPHDEDAQQCLHQYMLGPSLLVGCFTDEVWVPEGQWYNVWTEEPIEGGGWRTPEVPDMRGGPLLAPAGAVIPMGPVIDFVGQAADAALDIHVYAGAAGEIALYEDDGRTFDFEDGAFRTQRFTTEPVADGAGVHCDAAEGDFAGAVEERDCTLVMHGLPDATEVVVNGVPLQRAGYGPRPRWHIEDRQVIVSLGRRNIEHREAVVQ